MAFVLEWGILRRLRFFCHGIPACPDSILAATLQGSWGGRSSMRSMVNPQNEPHSKIRR
jgi:hypothetical protein